MIVLELSHESLLLIQIVSLFLGAILSAILIVVAVLLVVAVRDMTGGSSRSSGGPVMIDQRSLIGERGPEIE